MNELLGRIRCRLGRHDDYSIRYESGKAWRVYCRRCQRIDYDTKGWREDEREEKKDLARQTREALAAGRGLAVRILPSGQEQRREKGGEER